MRPLPAGKVLVTGGAGFIGSGLVKSLVEGGYGVVVVDDGRSGDWGRLPAEIHAVRRDIAEIQVQEWISLLQGCSLLFHLAAEKLNAPTATPESLLEVNLFATQKLFLACVEAIDPPKVIYTSSLYAYGNNGPRVMYESDPLLPDTVYGATKAAGEHLLRSLGRVGSFEWIAARPFFIYGPGQFAHGGYKSVIVKNFERLLRGEMPVVNGSGDQALDYVYIDDCVTALMLLAESSETEQAINIASGAAISISELTNMMLEVAGSSSVTPARGPSDWTEGTRRIGSPDLARERIGFSARTPMSLGLAKTWEWMNRG